MRVPVALTASILPPALLGLVMWAAVGPLDANQRPLDPAIFRTSATFQVDRDVRTALAVVATREPRPGAPGYSWIRVRFYESPLRPEDIARIGGGRPALPDRPWSAVLQLAVDRTSQIQQVDLSVPGHGCTVASTEDTARRFASVYHADARRLRLRASGSFVCDMTFMHRPSERFGWNVDLDVPIFTLIRGAHTEVDSARRRLVALAFELLDETA